jgi:hypothetical protein
MWGSVSMQERRDDNGPKPNPRTRTEAETESIAKKMEKTRLTRPFHAFIIFMFSIAEQDAQYIL